jgi:hypothetical protein
MTSAHLKTKKHQKWVASRVTPITPVQVTPITPVQVTPITPVQVTPITPVQVTPVQQVTPVTPVQQVTPVTPVQVTPITPVQVTPVQQVTPVTPVQQVTPVTPVQQVKRVKSEEFDPNLREKHIVRFTKCENQEMLEEHAELMRSEHQENYHQFGMLSSKERVQLRARIPLEDRLPELECDDDEPKRRGKGKRKRVNRIGTMRKQWASVKKMSRLMQKNDDETEEEYRNRLAEVNEKSRSKNDLSDRINSIIKRRKDIV